MTSSSSLDAPERRVDALDGALGVQLRDLCWFQFQERLEDILDDSFGPASRGTVPAATAQHHVARKNPLTNFALHRAPVIS